MAHVRKQIRDNVTTTLTGLSTTGTRVYQSRSYPLATAKLPGLLIYTRAEDIASTTLTRPRTKSRELQLVVEGMVAANTNLDNSLDQISLEVEEALVADVTRNGLAKDTELTSLETEYLADGETQAGIVRMTFLIRYMTLENDAETAV